MLNQEILSYIEAHSQEAYELLLTLARIPAPSNHEERRAEFCLDWLAGTGWLPRAPGACMWMRPSMWYIPWRQRDR